MKLIVAAFLSLIILGCSHPESSSFKRFKDVNALADDFSSREFNAKHKVVRIKDGDTFVLFIDGEEKIVRLEHIDCPEKKQPYGNSAKRFASNLCFGEYVTLKHENKYDRNKRLIAEVILPNGINVNKELVRNGLAWHFKKFSNNRVYAELEMNAKLEQIGIWSEPDPIAPWDWRHR